ncbi:MAG: hypothetical protein BHV77_01320 [Bacteroides sp. 43_108]|nr:MAG: hypothetical protein BHV77_01320 [Bacteroides sp. 43_108]
MQDNGKQAPHAHTVQVQTSDLHEHFCEGSQQNFRGLGAAVASPRKLQRATPEYKILCRTALAGHMNHLDADTPKDTAASGAV